MIVMAFDHYGQMQIYAHILTGFNAFFSTIYALGNFQIMSRILLISRIEKSNYYKCTYQMLILLNRGIGQDFRNETLLFYLSMECV